MERHLLHSVVNTEIKRPDSELVKRFAQHEVAKVGDAMAAAGIMHYEIKPIAPGMHACGPAVTVWTRSGDALFVQKVADLIKPGDMVVIDAGGCKDLSIIGDRICGFMFRQGAAGVIVDGAVRDIRGIKELPLPCWSRSVTPRLFSTNGPGAINIPIQCGGVTVNPGDIVLADEDGVVVVPQEDAERVLPIADAHLAGELNNVRRSLAGESFTEIFRTDPKIARWRE